MNIDSIIKLVEAGFSKEDIIKMTSASKPEPEAAKPEPEAAKPEPEVKPETKAEPDVIETKVSEAIDKAFKPFEDLYNNMAKLANMPSLNDVQPKGIEDIIDNFFKGD